MTVNSRIKIIYIITSTGIGGAEKIFYQTVTGMDYSKYHVSTCSLKEKGEIFTQGDVLPERNQMHFIVLREDFTFGRKKEC